MPHGCCKGRFGSRGCRSAPVEKSHYVLIKLESYFFFESICCFLKTKMLIVCNIVYNLFDI